MNTKLRNKWHIATPVGIAILILCALGVVALALNFEALNTDDRAKAGEAEKFQCAKNVMQAKTLGFKIYKEINETTYFYGRESCGGKAQNSDGSFADNVSNSNSCLLNQLVKCQDGKATCVNSSLCLYLYQPVSVGDGGGGGAGQDPGQPGNQVPYDPGPVFKHCKNLTASKQFCDGNDIYECYANNPLGQAKWLQGCTTGCSEGNTNYGYKAYCNKKKR